MKLIVLGHLGNASPSHSDVLEQRWTRFDHQSAVLVLGRGSNAQAEFVVSIDGADAKTADELLDAFCPANGGVTADRRDATLLGQPAREADISVTSECTVFTYLSHPPAPAVHGPDRRPRSTTVRS